MEKEHSKMENEENMVNAENEQTTEETETKKERIVLLDFIRGLLMIWVMFDHLFYSAAIFYGGFRSEFLTALSETGIRYYNGTYRSIVHPLVLFLFFFISGIVSDFSKNQTTRLIKLVIITFIVFFVTYSFTILTASSTNFTILFGVLYAFSVCGLVANILNRYNVSPKPVLIVGIILSVIGLLYLFGAISFLGKELFFLVNNKVGFEYSADYFSLLPYLGYMLIGYACGKKFYKEKKPHIKISPKAEKIMSPINFIGRTSLWWYLFSEVAYVGLFFLLMMLGA